MQSGGLPAAFSAFNMFYRPALLALYDHGGSLSSADAKCRKSGMSASFPVSYTHLDVYKRQLSDSLIILPKILPLVNGFLHLFLPFFDFFFTWILRSFAGEWSGRALPFANTCFVAFAERSPRTAEQRKYRRPATHYNV